MARKLLISIIIFLFFVPVLSFAQDKPISWEEKYRDELFTFLLIEQSFELKRDWSTQEKIHVVAKVQKEGAKPLGEIPISYDKSFQEVKDIKAFIITPEGKRLNYQSIQELTPYSGSPLYSDSREKVITMPNVVPGSTIEWQATILTKKPIIKDAFWESFSFTFEVPVKSLRYKIIIPKDAAIQIKSHNTDTKPEIKEEGGKTAYLWQRDFLDKFEPEEYMPPQDEFTEYVTVSTLKDWKEISDWLLGLINKNLRVSYAMKDKVKELTADCNSDKEKIQAIIKYIQDNFRYVSMGFGYHRYEPHLSDEIFNNKYGDCKDQVLVTMAMLKEAGITSYYTLNCSEDSGDPRNRLPLPGYFDHVILGIDLDGKLYYTDILIKGYRFAELPSGLQGGYVFVVNDKGGFFNKLPILDESVDSSYNENKIEIREDGSALVETTSLWSKEGSIEIRESWKVLTEKQRQEFWESLCEPYAAGGKVLERKWENIDEEYEFLRSVIKYERPQWAQVSGDFMVFGTGEYARDVYFATAKRTYPIMIWSNAVDKQTNKYLLPQGFEIATLPKDVNLNTEFAEFSRRYKTEGQSIIESEYFRYKRMRLPASDYNKVQDFYNKLAQLTNEKIIIKKKPQ